jgi:hypothetical protein
LLTEKWRAPNNRVTASFAIIKTAADVLAEGPQTDDEGAFNQMTFDSVDGLIHNRLWECALPVQLATTARFPAISLLHPAN